MQSLLQEWGECVYNQHCYGRIRRIQSFITKRFGIRFAGDFFCLRGHVHITLQKNSGGISEVSIVNASVGVIYEKKDRLLSEMVVIQ